MRLKRLFLAFVGALLSATVFTAAASACTDTYTGASGGSWGTPTNWSNTKVPTNTDDVCITSGTVVLTPYGVDGDTVKSLTISSGATLEIEGESSSYEGDYYQVTQLTVNNAVTIASGGNLVLDSTANTTTPVPNGATSGGTAQLYVAQDPVSGTSPTLTNNGTIITEEDPNTSFGEYIEGSVDNVGTLTDASGVLTVKSTTGMSANAGTWTVASGAATTLSGSQGFTNSGQLAANGPVTLTAGAWTQSGGSVTGSTVTLYNGDTLNYGSGTGSFEFTSGGATNFLSGTIPAGQTVSLVAGAAGNAVMVINTNVTNNGTFTMNAPAGSTGNPEVDSGNGAIFTNNGTVDLLDPTSGLQDLFRPNLTNSASGLINVESGTTEFGSGNPTGINNGTITIAPGAYFQQDGGTMTNNGTLSPGIASATSVGAYHLYEGTFNSGGSLSPTLAGGFVPAVGQEFVVFNIGNTDTYNGNFASGGNGFTVDSSKTSPEPGQVGVIYNPAPTTTAPGTPTTTTPGTPTTTTPGTPTTTPVSTGTASAAPLTVGKPRSVSGKLELALSCPAAHTCAGYTVTATVLEHLKGKQVVSVTATKKPPKFTTRTLTIATAKGSLAGGKSVTVKLAPNRAGAALLKRYGKLKVDVTVTEGTRKVTHTVTLTEPKPVKKTKK